LAKEAKDAKELEGCTFAPKLYTKKRKVPAKTPSNQVAINLNQNDNADAEQDGLLIAE
jgi:hypothetical protein